MEVHTRGPIYVDIVVAIKLVMWWYQENKILSDVKKKKNTYLVN